MARVAIRINDLHKSYGGQTILDGANVEIREDHRLAVIGRNGAGKSTLCRILLGREESDRGTIDIARGLNVAYLEQHDQFVPGETMHDYLIRTSGCAEWRCAEVAARFLVDNDRLAQPVAALSGGWQTRAKLCAMLLADPDFLVLDEPTNFLDTATQMLLERFLIDFKGGFVVVSHDREFLRRTCTSTMEVSRGQIYLHEGTVDAWLTHKVERRVDAERFNANQETKRRALEDFVARNKARASTASRANSKQKMLDKLETVEVLHDEVAVVITLPKVETRPGIALRTENLAIGYPDRPIAAGIDLEIERGKKVGVLGDNGQGKTTLLKTLTGALAPQNGQIRWGHAVRVGTYAQHVYTGLDPKLSVRDTLAKARRQSPRPVTDQQLLDLAGAFLFRGDEVDKKVTVLSGGERARLVLAGLMLGGFEVLVLDEPTNHLDVETTEALGEALKGHDGTVLFVSHDRAFVSEVADIILEVKDGKVLSIPDGYDAYLWRLAQQAAAVAPGKKPADSAKTAGKNPGKDTGRIERPTGKPNADLSRLRNEVTAAERKVAVLEAEKKSLEAKLATGYQVEAGTRLAAVISELAEAETRWFAAQERLAAQG